MQKVTWQHVAIALIVAVATVVGLTALLTSSKDVEFEASRNKITLKATQPSPEGLK